MGTKLKTSRKNISAQKDRFNPEDRRRYKDLYPNLTLMDSSRVKRGSRMESSWYDDNLARVNQAQCEINKFVQPRYQLCVRLNRAPEIRSYGNLRKVTEQHNSVDLTSVTGWLFLRTKRNIYGAAYNARKPEHYPNIKFVGFMESLLLDPHIHILYSLPSNIKNEAFLTALDRSVEDSRFKINYKNSVVAYDPRPLYDPEGMVKYCSKMLWKDPKMTAYDFLYHWNFEPIDCLKYNEIKNYVTSQ
jgi:hypothetical protein